jgi:hypothetical protein
MVLYSDQASLLFLQVFDKSLLLYRYLMSLIDFSQQL